MTSAGVFPTAGLSQSADWPSFRNSRQSLQRCRPRAMSHELRMSVLRQLQRSRPSRTPNPPSPNMNGMRQRECGGRSATRLEAIQSPESPAPPNRPARHLTRAYASLGLRAGLKPHQGAAAAFNLESARILTRTLAGFAAALIISPLAGFRTSVPAFRAGTLRRLTFRRPGSANSPTPFG